MCLPEVKTGNSPSSCSTAGPAAVFAGSPKGSDEEVSTGAAGANNIKLKPGMKIYTRKEVEELSSGKDDVYMFIIKKKVYKVPAKWAMNSHPGGEILLRDAKGTDISISFLGNHRMEVVEPLLKRFHVGYVESEQSVMEKEFVQLVEDLQDDPEWFRASALFYIGVQVRYIALLGSSVLCLLYGESYFVRCILSAILLGVYFQQVAFIGHDTGHNGVTHSIAGDTCLGLFWGNAMSGISGGWWKATHNVHHLVTNSVEFDPDIQHMPVFAVTEKYFNNIYSEYHMKTFQFDKLAQTVLRFQHFLYYPIMALARFNLYLQSIILCLSPYDTFRRWGGKSRVQELACLGFFWGWFSLLVSHLPTTEEKVTFLLLSHAIAGILHVQITISHFPMPVVDGNPLKQDSSGLNFVELQLQGTIDVDCPSWMDWFHGGLQFQATHHLIPRIPRHNLRRLRDEKIKPFCKKHGLEYKSAGFFECNWLVIDCLRKTANQISPFLLDGLNAQG